VNSMPRPGTSLSAPKTGGGSNQSVRPVSSSGRPLTGFSRPATNSGRPLSGQVAVDAAFRSDGSGQKVSDPSLHSHSRFLYSFTNTLHSALQRRWAGRFGSGLLPWLRVLKGGCSSTLRSWT